MNYTPTPPARPHERIQPLRIVLTFAGGFVLVAALLIAVCLIGAN